MVPATEQGTLAGAVSRRSWVTCSKAGKGLPARVCPKSKLELQTMVSWTEVTRKYWVSLKTNYKLKTSDLAKHARTHIPAHACLMMFIPPSALMKL